MSYTIFNHGQLGQVCEAVQRSKQEVIEPCQPAQPACKRQTPQQKRVRSPRGWAVAAGLGLGAAFKGGRR